MSKILKREDIQQINTPESVASLFCKLGYDACCQPIDVEDLELPPKSADAVTEACFIANKTDANLQVLLFQLSSQSWTSDSAALTRMRAIANSLCKRPSHFLLLATLDYRQLLLVSPQKTLNIRMELKLSIAKTFISLNDPSFYEIQLLEKVAVQSLTPRNLYHIQHQTLSSARQEKEKFVDDPIRDYLQRIGRVRLLTAEQEILLSRKVQRKIELEVQKRQLRKNIKREPQDAEWAAASGMTLSNLYENLAVGHLARNKLIEANLRLVVSIAKQYQHRGLEFLELIQEGNFGLMKAVEKFDPSKGYRFSTYAYFWIRQSITRAIQVYSRLIRVPIYCWEKFNKVKKSRRVLIQTGKNNPSFQEIVISLDMKIEEVRELMQIFQPLISLDNMVGDDQDTKLEELILANHFNDSCLETIASTDYINSILLNLTEREKQVIVLCFGLDGNEEKTLQAIADQLGGLSRERVRQIRNKALTKMKVALNKDNQKQLLDTTVINGYQGNKDICSLAKNSPDSEDFILHHTQIQMVQYHIQFDSDIPASKQLFDQIQFAIASRQHPPGHRLPSTRQLAMITGLHRNTISKVYQQLEETGLVESQAGSGIYVKIQGLEGETQRQSPILKEDPKRTDQSLDVVKLCFEESKEISVQEKFKDLNDNRKMFPQCDRALKAEITCILQARVYKTIAQFVYMIWGITRHQDYDLYEVAKEELLNIFDYNFPLV